MLTDFNIKQRHFSSENSKEPLGRPVVFREMRVSRMPARLENESKEYLTRILLIGGLTC